MQKRAAIGVLGIDIAFVGRRPVGFVDQQQLRDFLVSLRHRNDQRRFALVVPGIDVGFVRQQRLDDFLVPFMHRHVQRRPAVSVLGVDVGFVRQQQLRELFMWGGFVWGGFVWVCEQVRKV